MPTNNPARAARRLFSISTALCGLGFANAALADCVPDSTGQNVVCSGTSASYTNGNTGVTLNSTSDASIAGPLILGPGATVTHAGTLTGPTSGFALQAGDNSVVTNNGSMASTATVSGSGVALLGDYASFTNNGTLTAVAGTPVVQFGRGGTFINTQAAPAAVAGNIEFGPSIGGDVATFVNSNTSFGFSGNVDSVGNTVIDNSGLFTGKFSQIATLGTVNILNEAGGTFAGTISTGDVTTLTNNGVMTLNGRSLIGTLGSAGTQVVNNGTLSIGATPATMIVNGAFVQSGSGVLNIPILPSTVPTAGSSFGQVYATGSNGTASLGGTLNLVPTAGFYPTGSIYPVILADKGITGSFASLTGTSLPFVQFVPLGVVTINGTQQAYELQVERTATYSQAIASVATPNQIAVATGFQPMVDYASANLGTDAASLVGLVDLLTIAQAQTFFDSVSPEGYAAYATAMRDQANLLLRKVTLRMTDQNSDHHETGWWLTGSHQFQFGSAQGYETKNGITDVIGGYDLSGPHHVLGLSLGYSYDSLHYAPGSMIGHNAQTQVAIYGAYTLGPIVASGQVGYEFGHIAATKTITIGATTRTATASSPDHLLVAEGTLSLNAKAEGLLISPFVGIEYDHGSITPFTEAGADAADLTVNRIDASRTDLLLGANITRAKGKWRPYARVAYRSELGTDNAGTISAYFNGDTTTSFTVAGLAAARHEIDGDVGMNIVFDDEGGLFLGYQGTYRSDALSSHGVMAGIRLEF